MTTCILRLLTLLLLFAGFTGSSSAQNVNGVVLLDSLNLKVVKVWGTHQERGYAYGYLLAADLNQMLVNYVKPIFGSSYTTARNLVLAGNDLEIDAKYIIESQGIIDGMTAAGMNPGQLDATDVLVGNCLLDLMGLMGMKAGMGCSSLLDWGDATLGTPLDGKSVISRHLDWQINSTLLNNQVLLVQQPSEPDEQNWALIGFAGMISALSGFNGHLGLFQHVMDDYSGGSQHNQHYKPVWFAMRDALEKADYNGDGACNVIDARASLDDSPNGFADAWIISALAESSPNDSLTAMIAEITPGAPTHTYRYRSYPDSIAGDNLYTANYQIARNNAMHFCTRYNAIRSHLGSGTLIGLDENWNLLRDWSHLSHNLQFMQFSPEANHLRVAVRTNQAAYLSSPIDFNLTDLLDQSVGISEHNRHAAWKIWPNPCRDVLHLEHPDLEKAISAVEIFDFLGKQVYSTRAKKHTSGTLHLGGLKQGLYLLRLTAGDQTERLVFIKQ